MDTLAGLRVGLVGPVPPPAGGMAMQTRQLGELLRQAQVQVEAVATNAPYRPAWVGSVRGLRAVFRLLPYLWALWRVAGRSDVMHVMANSGWSWHLFAAPAVWIARLRRVPVVVNYRGGEAAEFLRRSARSVSFTLRRSAALVVPSGFLHGVFKDHGIASQVVPNIVDLQRFRPGTRDAAPQVLVARNLEPIYDIGTAVRAFAAVRAVQPTARLVVAGSGPQAAELKALAAELGLDDAVDFVGRLERDDMASRLRRCHVALNPSRVDNMPNSVLEALASGVPVVSTDVGGVRHVVEHERTALLVPAGDAQAMADALLRVLQDPSLAARLAQAGLQEVQRYTWAVVGPQWGRVYRSAQGLA
jgi:glycosyltransferase involved in cell wall biosynthesis